MDVEMKDETRVCNYGDENIETMNICKDNDFKNIKTINNNRYINHKRSITNNNSLCNINLLSQSSIFDKNRNNLSLRKMRERFSSYCDFKNNINFYIIFL